MFDPITACAIHFLKDTVIDVVKSRAKGAITSAPSNALHSLSDNLKKFDAKENYVLYRAVLIAHWQAIQQTAASYAAMNHIEVPAKFDRLDPRLQRIVDSFRRHGEVMTLRSAVDGDSLRELIAACEQRIAGAHHSSPQAPPQWAETLNSIFGDLTTLMARKPGPPPESTEAAWSLLQLEYPVASACIGYREVFIFRWYEYFCVNFQLLTKAPDVAPLLAGKLFAEIKEREDSHPLPSSIFVNALEASVQRLLEGMEQRIVGEVQESEKRTTHVVTQVGEDLGHRLDLLTEQVNLVINSGPRTAPVEADAEDTPQAAKAVHNVPDLWNETIGRAKEVRDVSAVLLTHRLVTIWGPGGSGKTRIAIEVARRLEPDFERGTLFVDLASLAPATGEDSLVPSRIATVAGVREQVKRPPTEILAEHFRHGNVLLILDNCEHLIPSCISTVIYLITHCPGLKVLATSRTRFDHPAEQSFPLGPLAFPGFTDNITPDQAMQSPAVQLFVQRVQRGTDPWVLNHATAAPVAEVCRTLEGLPLAIEVAARNLAVQSVEEMGQNSRRLLDFLGEMKAGDIRHWNSLSAVFQWSCDLLGADELTFLKTLSVFDGGWNADAATGVCEIVELHSHSVLWHLRKLIDHSLLFDLDWKHGKRFRFQEPMRQFIQSRITPSEHSEYQRRHAHYFATLLDEHKHELLGKQQTETLDLIQAEVDNIRAAIRWAVAKGDTETGLRLVAATWRFCEIRGFLTEGRERAQQVLSMPKSQELPALRSAVLSGAGILAFRQGDFESAEKMFQQSHDLESALGNHAGVANALSDLAIIAHEKGETEQANQLQRESLTIERRLGNERQVAVLLNNMGSARAAEGKYDEAEGLLTESAELFRKLENSRDRAFALNHLANLAIYKYDYPAARAYAEESLGIRRSLLDTKGTADTLRSRARLHIEMQDYASAKTDLNESLLAARSVADKKGVMECLGMFASLAAQTGDFLRGVLLYAAADQERTKSRLTRAWHNIPWSQRDLQAAGEFFARAEFDKLWETGNKIPLPSAFEVAAQIGASPSQP